MNDNKIEPEDSKESEDLEQGERPEDSKESEDPERSEGPTPEDPQPKKDEQELPEPEGETKETEESTEPSLKDKAIKKAFVVLCEREKVNKEVLTALDQFDIEPIILYPDNPDLTIEQKFMSNPHVTFSCVVLAGDDFIYDRQTGKPATAVLGAKSSAVFHCGYLLGKFGRMNTFILYKSQDAFQLPTILHNAIFTPYEPNGHWPEFLESRLKEAGLI